MNFKRALLLFLLFSASFSCFSISDQSAVEIETKTNMKPLLEAKNVLFDEGKAYFKVPKNILVTVSRDSVRISFPIEEVKVFHCYGKAHSLSISCPMESIGREASYVLKNGSTVLSTYKIGGEWHISLTYEGAFPEWVKKCIQLPELECYSDKVPRVNFEGDVKKTVREVLEMLRSEGVVNLNTQDIEEIVNASELGNAGHNGRIVKEGGKWKPYYKTSNPLLLKGFVTAGCGSGEVIEAPAHYVEFAHRKTLVERFMEFVRALLQIFRF